jgi:hypothetical protein
MKTNKERTHEPSSERPLERVVIPHEKIHNEKCELLKYIQNFLKESAPVDQIGEEIKNAFYRLY